MHPLLRIVVVSCRVDTVELVLCVVVNLGFVALRFVAVTLCEEVETLTSIDWSVSCRLVKSGMLLVENSSATVELFNMVDNSFEVVVLMVACSSLFDS